MSAIGGTLNARVDGATVSAKGDWTYNTGQAKREQVVGIDGVHGYREMPQVPFVEGMTSDIAGVDLEALKNARDVPVELALVNGKTVVFKNATYCADGDHTIAEGEVQLRFEAESAEVIT